MDKIHKEKNKNKHSKLKGLDEDLTSEESSTAPVDVTRIKKVNINRKEEDDEKTDPDIVDRRNNDIDD